MPFNDIKSAMANYFLGSLDKANVVYNKTHHVIMTVWKK